MGKENRGTDADVGRTERKKKKGYEILETGRRGRGRGKTVERKHVFPLRK